MFGITRRQIDTAGGPLLEGSSNVFANGKSVVRLGDRVQSHGRSNHSSAVMIEGSSTVFCNGKPVCRKGHRATCGDQATGSSNVFLGG
jgi:uncharacterized Zn-binding protein involved in type VI secretion